MQSILKFILLFFVSIVFAQQNMDTIYGSPKFVKDEIIFLKTKIPKRYTEYQGNNFMDIIRYKKGNLKNFFKDINVSYINCKTDFNNKGFREKEVWYDFSNEVLRKYEYRYDRNQNLIEQKEIEFDDEFFLTKFHYNKKNKLILMSYYQSDAPNEFVHWYSIRDENNNVVESKRIDEDGIDYTTLYELNNNDKVIGVYNKSILNTRRPKSVHLKFKDQVTKILSYDYDKKGNKIRQFNYDETSAKPYLKTVWKYDDQNNLAQIKRFKNSNDTTDYRVVNYKYNYKGFEIYKEESVTKDTVFSIIKTFYNEDDYIIKTIVLDNNKTKTLDFKYKFDKHGNWIKITTNVNGEPFYAWVRKIKYY